jgi:hypothetical protein
MQESLMLGRWMLGNFGKVKKKGLGEIMNRPVIITRRVAEQGVKFGWLKEVLFKQIWKGE